MSELTYYSEDEIPRKPLIWLRGEIKSPPFSKSARIEAGNLLRRLQEGEILAMPFSRPMPSIGPRCHELRVRDETANWRIIYRIDADSVLVVEIFGKASRKTPRQIIESCSRRLAMFDET